MTGKPHAPETPPRDNLPRSLGRYRLLRLIGLGGMSEVFLGYDEAEGRSVAIKILQADLARDHRQLGRFQREAQLALMLDDPNIVRGFDCGLDPETGRPYVVLEFIDGPSAQARFDRVGRFEVSDVVHVGLAMARALHHLHGRKFVHRDIKPDNILLSPCGAAKLTDLGLVRWNDANADPLTLHSDGFGTSYYMPYEQCLNAHMVDARSDIFALGATLYHLATGRVPFYGQDHGDIMRMKEAGHFTPPSMLNPKIPRILDAILAKMLALDPEKRFQSAAQVFAALKRTGLAEDLPSYADLGQSVRDLKHKARGNAEPTRPDLSLRQSILRNSRAGHLWYLRFRDRRGKACFRKGTTQQIVNALKKGRLRGLVLAARGQDQHFRPLAEYPEFHACSVMPSSKPVPVTPPKADRHCWYRRMLISLGFSLLVFGVASVTACFWSPA